MQYRVQLLKSLCIVGSGACSYAIPYFQRMGTQFHQQRTKMQQILKSKFIFRPGNFKHIKIDEGTKCERKLQRQPAPVSNVS